MHHQIEKRLALFSNEEKIKLLKQSQVGIEKESLRVSLDGKISQLRHPHTFGSSLTHPSITTDYSEALLELITPPYSSLDQAYKFLYELHQFIYSELDNELLWATSMPCVLAGEKSIRIAEYGNSNAGKMKYVYRKGLGVRYGKIMQVVAGVHYNYSFSNDFWIEYQHHEKDKRPLQSFIADAYFHIIRNLQRFGWLIPYLFGSSPAICKSFLEGHPQKLSEFDSNTYYEPYATSLRMSDIGYQNNKEHKAGLNVSYNNLDEYIASLTWAIETVHEEYENFGVLVDGEYQQLNANILQIENEYYSTVRPKQTTGTMEKPTIALKQRGVQYVELRSLDVNAFDSIGIDMPQLYFLDAFIVLCLMTESPPISTDEGTEIDNNQNTAALQGRKPAVKLQRNGHSYELKKWAMELCNDMQGICEILDEGEDKNPYTSALKLQMDAILDAELTPSAKILAEMREHKEHFFQFAMRKSIEHQDYFRKPRLPDSKKQHFHQLAELSHQQQKKLETTDDGSFDSYLKKYFSQTLG